MWVNTAGLFVMPKWWETFRGQLISLSTDGKNEPILIDGQCSPQTITQEWNRQLPIIFFWGFGCRFAFRVSPAVEKD